MQENNLEGFNANEVPPDVGREIMASGDAKAIIIESATKESKENPDNRFLSLCFQIVSGPYQNRKIYVNLSLWCKSEDAVRISKSQLSAICRAVNVISPRSSTELHDKPLLIGIGQRINKKTGVKENYVTSYKPVSAGPQAMTPATPGPTAGPTKAPW